MNQTIIRPSPSNHISSFSASPTPPSASNPHHLYSPIIFITPSFDSPFSHPSFAHLSHFYNTPFLPPHTTTITSYHPYFPIISLPAHYSHITSISSSSPIFHHSISLIFPITTNHLLAPITQFPRHLFSTPIIQFSYHPIFTFLHHNITYRYHFVCRLLFPRPQSPHQPYSHITLIPYHPNSTIIHSFPTPNSHSTHTISISHQPHPLIIKSPIFSFLDHNHSPISLIPLYPQYSHQPYSSINLIALSPQFSIIPIFSYTQFPQHSHHSHHTSAQSPSPQFSNHPVFSYLEHNHSPISPTSHHPQLLPFITLIPPSTQFPYHPHFPASLSPNPHTLPTSIPFLYHLILTSATFPKSASISQSAPFQSSYSFPHFPLSPILTSSSFPHHPNFPIISFFLHPFFPNPHPTSAPIPIFPIIPIFSFLHHIIPNPPINSIPHQSHSTIIPLPHQQHHPIMTIPIPIINFIAFYRPLAEKKRDQIIYLIINFIALYGHLVEKIWNKMIKNH